MPDEEKELDVVPDGDDLIAPPPLHALLPPPAISRTGSANTHVLIEGEPCVRARRSRACENAPLAVQAVLTRTRAKAAR
jgi:hypothetical protein